MRWFWNEEIKQIFKILRKNRNPIVILDLGSVVSEANGSKAKKVMGPAMDWR